MPVRTGPARSPAMTFDRRIKIAPHHIVLRPYHPPGRPPEPALVIRIDRRPLRRPPGARGFERPRIIIHAVNRDDHHIRLSAIDRRRSRTRIHPRRYNPRAGITRPQPRARPRSRLIDIQSQPSPIERRKHIPRKPRRVGRLNLQCALLKGSACGHERKCKKERRERRFHCHVGSHAPLASGMTL